MTEDRGTGSDAGDNGEAAGDGLDAWMAANFPPPKSEPTPGPEPTPVPPVQAPPPVDPPRVAPPPVAPPTQPPFTSPPTFSAAPAATPASPPDAGQWPPVSTPPSLENPPAQQPAPSVPFGDQAHEPPALPPVAEELGGIPSAAELPPAPTEAFADLPGASGIDALFGESNFLEYTEGITATESPFARRPVDKSTSVESESQPGDGNGDSEGDKKSQKVLLWVAGSLVALLALIALFMVGTKLPAILGPAPDSMVAPVPTPTPTPTATELPLGPVEPGEYVWDELLGGECVAPYEGPWEVRYTVVDCEVPHPAQLVTRGTFVTQDGATGYPGLEALKSQVNLLCTATDVVDYAKAAAYTNIQFEASYAVSSQDWASGNHSYYCFLSRSDGGDLTGTIAMPQVAPEPEPSEEPAP